MMAKEPDIGDPWGHLKPLKGGFLHFIHASVHLNLFERQNLRRTNKTTH